VGSADLLFEHHDHLRDLIPDASEQLVRIFADPSEALERAERELEFIDKKNMRCMLYTSPDYPQRLLECDDSPVVLFYYGTADLNPRHIISIVGTRHCTNYGRDICRNLIEELHYTRPDTLVVSGLAYGIDICAHRESLNQDIPTVSVMAHGLDRIYPRTHRETAVRMVKNGGLLTEYITGTEPDKGNFVQRNRIVAGMSDATIVIESAERGGSLITARLAHSYGREVLAFPGRVCDEYSRGCNRIIQNQMAHAIHSAKDLLDLMNWPSIQPNTTQPLQQEFFADLSPDEQLIIDCLASAESCNVNDIVTTTSLSFSNVNVLLFELESQGIIDYVGGNSYRLLRKHLSKHK